MKPVVVNDKPFGTNFNDTVIAKPYRPVIDWQYLEHEFIVNEDFAAATTWLREVKGWNFNRIHAGNTQRHIREWGNKRAEVRRKNMEARREQAELLFREMLPDLIRAKVKISKYFTKLIHEDIEKLPLRGVSLILNKIKTELGEPIVITQSQAEQNTTPGKDPAQALLEAFGVLNADGSINLEVTGGYDYTKIDTSTMLDPINSDSYCAE